MYCTTTKNNTKRRGDRKSPSPVCLWHHRATSYHTTTTVCSYGKHYSRRVELIPFPPLPRLADPFSFIILPIASLSLRFLFSLVLSAPLTSTSTLSPERAVNSCCSPSRTPPRSSASKPTWWEAPATPRARGWANTRSTIPSVGWSGPRGGGEKGSRKPLGDEMAREAKGGGLYY